MCGICGFCGFEDKSLIVQMMDSIIHRGPDDHGIFSDEAVTLGHRRLSIIDLSVRGKQPLSNENGDLWIIFNGEIYNYRELKGSLKNHTFSSDSDTEVIIHAYEEYGMAFLEKLRGMFAFALYDSSKKTVILARDPIGKKPLYYCREGSRFAFASEIKALLEIFPAFGIPRKINDHALCSYLQNQYVAGQKTLVDGIFRLRPGTALVYDLGTGKIQNVPYWVVRERIENGDESYFAGRLKALLEESTRLRLIADVPVGSFLSGGVDSSAITAIATRHVDYDFHTFSAGFGELFSECRFAREVADHLGTIHHEILIEPADVIREFDKVTWHFDEPLGDAAVIANYFLSKKAHEYVKVVLAGEGSDELFGGYSSYRSAIRWHRWFDLPPIIRRAVEKTIAHFPGNGNPVTDEKLVYAKYLGQDSLELAQQYAWKITGISNEEMKWLGISRCQQHKDDLYYPEPMKNPLNRVLAHDCLNHLPDLYLMKADKATMAHSVEERVPILDVHMIEFAFSIPPSLKIRNDVEKYIWKKAVADIVPRSVIQRKKQGFGVPYRLWISKELRDVAVQTLEEGSLCKRMVDPLQLKTLLSNLSRDKPGRSALIAWNLFALERWAKVF